MIQRTVCVFNNALFPLPSLYLSQMLPDTPQTGSLLRTWGHYRFDPAR